MARYTNDSVMDAALGVIDNATIRTVCSAQPTTRTEAITTYALADATPSFTGPADGSPDGRQIIVDQNAGVAVDTSGTPTHVALCDGSALIHVTTCTGPALTAGSTVTIPAETITFRDPTAP